MIQNRTEPLKRGGLPHSIDQTSIRVSACPAWRWRTAAAEGGGLSSSPSIRSPLCVCLSTALFSVMCLGQYTLGPVKKRDSILQWPFIIIFELAHSVDSYKQVFRDSAKKCLTMPTRPSTKLCIWIGSCFRTFPRRTLLLLSLSQNQVGWKTHQTQPCSNQD